MAVDRRVAALGCRRRTSVTAGTALDALSRPVSRLPQPPKIGRTTSDPASNCSGGGIGSAPIPAAYCTPRGNRDRFIPSVTLAALTGGHSFLKGERARRRMSQLLAGAAPAALFSSCTPKKKPRRSDGASNERRWGGEGLGAAFRS